MTGTRLLSLLIVVLLAGLVALRSQTLGQKERFTAVAIVNNNLGSGAGVVQIDITRWSAQSERTELLREEERRRKAAGALQDMRPWAPSRRRIHWPRPALREQTSLEGGRRSCCHRQTDRVLGSDRGRGHRTQIQMEIDRNGEGKGTLSYATKIIPQGDTIVLEGFATQPIMLTQIKSEAHTE